MGVFDQSTQNNGGPLTKQQDIFGGIFSALGGLGGGLFPNGSNSNTSGNGTSNTQTQSYQDTNLQTLLDSILKSSGVTTGVSDTTSYGASDMSSTQDVTPTMSPETLALLHTLIGKAGALQAPSLTGYGAYQTSQINSNANAQRQAVDNIMASRGLSTSPVAATSSAGIEQNRINQITGMEQQLPLLQNQMNLANLAGASSFFSTIPKGQTSTGRQVGQTIGTQHQTSAGTSEQTQTGEQTGTQTGHTQGQQTQNTQTTQQQQQQEQAKKNPLGGLFSGIASALPFILPLFSDRDLKKDIVEIPQDKAMGKIRELKGKEWKWKGGQQEDAGVIAQELESVLPGLVHTTKTRDMELKSVNYAGLIPYLIGAVQNLDSRIGE